MVKALQRGNIGRMVERESKETEEHQEEGNSGGKGKNNRVKERMRV